MIELLNGKINLSISADAKILYSFTFYSDYERFEGSRSPARDDRCWYCAKIMHLVSRWKHYYSRLTVSWRLIKSCNMYLNKFQNGTLISIRLIFIAIQQNCCKEMVQQVTWMTSNAISYYFSLFTYDNVRDVYLWHSSVYFVVKKLRLTN